MRAPERVRALPGAPSAPRRSKARQACGRLQACARVARGRQTRPLALPLPPLEFLKLSKRSDTVSEEIRGAEPCTSGLGHYARRSVLPEERHPKLPGITGASGSPTATLRTRDVFRCYRVLLAPAAAQRRNSTSAATVVAFAHCSRKREPNGEFALAQNRKPPLIGGLGGRHPKP